MGSIYLIRHGQASFGLDDYDNLSPLGVEQSGLLGQHFQKTGLRFDAVYGGAMNRHRQTANACLEAMKTDGTQLIPLPELNEYDFENVIGVYKPEFAISGALTHYLAKQINPQKAFQQIFTKAMRHWISGHRDEAYRESWGQFKSRCKQGFSKIIVEAKPSQHIAVFTSGGAITSNVQQLLQVPDSEFVSMNWSMVNCAITHFLYNDAGVSLNYLNNYSHLQSVIGSHLVTYR